MNSWRPTEETRRFAADPVPFAESGTGLIVAPIGVERCEAKKTGEVVPRFDCRFGGFDELLNRVGLLARHDELCRASQISHSEPAARPFVDGVEDLRGIDPLASGVYPVEGLAQSVFVSLFQDCGWNGLLTLLVTSWMSSA